MPDADYTIIFQGAPYASGVYLTPAEVSDHGNDGEVDLACVVASMRERYPDDHFKVTGPDGEFTFHPDDWGPALTPDQLREVKDGLLPGNGTDGCPHFAYKGRAIRIEDGYLYPKGTNLIHVPHYWRMTRATARKVAKWLGCNAYFSKGA